jgi:hypothetical protein
VIALPWLRRFAAVPKVFGIGFHKTGTSSLRTALQHLGYRVAGPNGVDDPDIAANALPMALRIARRHDAFQDNPWPILFREMDRAFPGSRFVCTLRPAEAWIRSAVEHFGAEETPMRRWIYGVGAPLGNEDVYLRRYERHYREVREYFAARPRDILYLPITEGAGWPELCAFLGKDVPAIPFPHSNAKAARAGKG